jgi:hypothetical protein
MKYATQPGTTYKYLIHGDAFSLNYRQWPPYPGGTAGEVVSLRGWLVREKPFFYGS